MTVSLTSVQFARPAQAKSSQSKQCNFLSSGDLNQTLLSCITAGCSVGCRISNECPFIIIMQLL